MANHSVKRKLNELLLLLLHALHVLAFQQILLMQVAAGLLEQLQNTTDRDQKEWEAFAQTMYDEVGKARAARNMLQRYSFLVCLSFFLPHAQSNRAGQSKHASWRGGMFSHTQHIV